MLKRWDDVEDDADDEVRTSVVPSQIRPRVTLSTEEPLVWTQYL